MQPTYDTQPNVKMNILEPSSDLTTEISMPNPC